MNSTIKFILTLTIGIFLLACESNEPEEVEIISMEDLMGYGGDDFTDSSEMVVDSIISDQSNLSFLVSTLNHNYDTTALKESHAIDRYGFNSSKKIKFIGKEEVPYGKSNMVTPKAEFYMYHFSDSVKLNNAFYNWLDCFGSDCNEVKLNEDIESVKTPPSFTLVYDTTLISVKYLCEHDKNDWRSFQDSILKQYGENYRYRIDVECGGPLKWK